MQKKLYYLDEQEKNRILNLHESRTKKHYLINETESKTQAEIEAIIKEEEQNHEN